MRDQALIDMNRIMTSPASRRDAFSRIGGHIALDLVNTVEWRLSEEQFEEDLADFEDVLRWSAQAGTLSESESSSLTGTASLHSAEADAESARIRALREDIYAAAFEAADPAPVLDAYREAVASGRLRPAEKAWTWDLPVDLALPRRRIALEAFDLLTRADRHRFAQCQDADCGWVFLDTSPRRNRRWCVSADCGNRNRVRDFYERSRTASSAT
jgi:predicted RNA-binding Zn ribbon-like protein